MFKKTAVILPGLLEFEWSRKVVVSDPEANRRRTAYPAIGSSPLPIGTKPHLVFKESETNPDILMYCREDELERLESGEVCWDETQLLDPNRTIEVVFERSKRQWGRYNGKLPKVGVAVVPFGRWAPLEGVATRVLPFWTSPWSTVVYAISTVYLEVETGETQITDQAIRSLEEQAKLDEEMRAKGLSRGFDGSYIPPYQVIGLPIWAPEDMVKKRFRAVQKMYRFDLDQGATAMLGGLPLGYVQKMVVDAYDLLLERKLWESHQRPGRKTSKPARIEVKCQDCGAINVLPQGVTVEQLRNARESVCVKCGSDIRQAPEVESAPTTKPRPEPNVPDISIENIEGLTTATVKKLKAAGLNTAQAVLAESNGRIKEVIGIARTAEKTTDRCKEAIAKTELALRLKELAEAGAKGAKTD